MNNSVSACRPAVLVAAALDNPERLKSQAAPAAIFCTSPLPGSAEKARGGPGHVIAPFPCELQRDFRVHAK